MRRVRWLAILAFLLIPGVAQAIQLHWSSGADTLTFAEATRAILVLRADSAEVTLPAEWRLLWVGDAEVQVVELDSLEVCPGDTAQVYDVDGPSTLEDSTAHQVTARFCSGGSRFSQTALTILALPAGSAGKAKVLSRDCSGLIAESNEVTYNGGVLAAFPDDSLLALGNSAGLQLDDVAPAIATGGMEVTLDIAGAGFCTDGTAELRYHGEVFAAAPTRLASTREVSAVLRVPLDACGTMDLAISQSDTTVLLRNCLTINAPMPQAGSGGTRVLYRPTNSSAAHTQIDLYASDRTGSGWLDHAHSPEQNYYGWPQYLSDSTLVPIRQSPHGPDSIAVIRSTPENGILLEHTDCPAYVTYYLHPPQYATSLAVLASASHVYDGPDAPFVDSGKPVLTVRPTFEHPFDFASTFCVGSQIRSWRTSTLICNDGGSYTDAFFVALPTDTIVTQVYSGPGTGGYYDVHYDVQRVRFPEEAESLKVTAIKLAGERLPHPCARWGRSEVSGLAVWPEFVIHDDKGEGVVRQSQYNPLWRDHPFGGYVDQRYGLVGTRRTIGWSGCSVSCIAMGLSYMSGRSYTVDEVNSYLQSHQGYSANHVAVVRALDGDSVIFVRLPGGNLRVGDSVLIERAQYRPLAALAVTRLWADTLGSGRIYARYPYYGEPHVGDGGVYYFNRVASVVSQLGRGRVTYEAPRAKCDAAAVESLLVRSNLAMAITHSKSGAWHWVLVDGWVPAFAPPDSAHGTYHLKDPAYGTTRLIDGYFKNEYQSAMFFRNIARQTEALQADTTLASSVGSGGSGLCISLGGYDSAVLIYPTGRSLRFDAEGMIDEPGDGVVFIGRGTDDDELEPGEEGGNIDMVELYEPPDGQYTVSIFGGCLVSAATWGPDGAIAHDGAMENLPAGTGSVYSITYSAADGAVSVAKVGVAGVDEGGRAVNVPVAIVPLRNPAVGKVSFRIYGCGQGTITVFDVMGRRVGRIPFAGSAGGQVVTWEAARGQRAGVYFAVLEALEGRHVARCVLVE
jgi:hypothetical protein